MTRRAYLLVAAAGTAGGLLLLASAPRSARALVDPGWSAPTTFTDQSGDSGTAADITTVTVANTQAGLYSFDIAFATPYAATATASIYLDTDLNPSTGDQNGADYVLYHDHDSGRFGLYVWSAGKWVLAPSQADAVLGLDANNHLQATVDASDLGGSHAFDFFVETTEGGSNGDYDVAPSGTGEWSYVFAPPLVLSVAAYAMTVPKPGREWVVTFAVQRSDNGAFVGSEATVFCNASGAGRKLAVVAKLVGTPGDDEPSAFACAFRIPRKLAHRLVHATIAIQYLGRSASHAFTTRVR